MPPCNAYGVDMKKGTKIMVCVTLALIALGITLYPLISNFFAEANRSLVETRYEKAVEQLDDSEIISAHSAAQNYNSMLLNVTEKPYTRDALQKASESYDQLLNIRDDGIMGYLQIPILNMDLPIYHGTDEKTLDHGLGHLLGSSLPVGGTGTHSVITGHSGLAGQRIFSDLDKLQTGDIFYLKVLDDTLAYMVMEIDTVLPEDTSKLTVYPDQDNVTLVTCTPYGVNTHRLLVRGTRIPYEQAETIVQESTAVETPKSTWRQEYMKGLIYGLAGIIAVAGSVAVIMFSNKHRSTAMKMKPRSDRYSMPSPHLTVSAKSPKSSYSSSSGGHIKFNSYDMTPVRKQSLLPQRKRGKHEAP